MSVVELSIDGMTCASCANRIEKKLNKIDGVTATVNFATEKARVEFGDDVTADQLVATVEDAGYQAHLPTSDPDCRWTRIRPLRFERRLLISLALTVPVVAMAMVPALQFTYWQWLSLALAAPVVLWGAWPFHRAAWSNLRHGTATMDTLISMGTLAALGWSVYALFWGTAGTPGMTHAFELTIGRTDGSGNIYLEAAAGVTTFILAGRYFEARSKRRAGAALRAMLELGAKDVTVRRNGAEQRIPIDRAEGRRRVRGAPGREDRHRWRGRRGTLALSTRRCSPGSRCRSKSNRAPTWSAPPSTPTADWWCGRTGSAPTRHWRRWPGWSRTPRTGRRRRSGWPTGSPGLRADRHRVVRGDAGVLDRHRRTGRGGVHRGGGGADHRVSRARWASRRRRR